MPKHLDEITALPRTSTHAAPARRRAALVVASAALTQPDPAADAVALLDALGLLDPALDRITLLADELRHRVRTHPADENGPWLAAQLRDGDLWALVWTLAAMVPADRGFDDLTAWASSTALSTGEAAA